MCNVLRNENLAARKLPVRKRFWHTPLPTWTNPFGYYATIYLNAILKIFPAIQGFNSNLAKTQPDQS